MDTGPVSPVPARWAAAMARLDDAATERVASILSKAVDPTESWERLGTLLERHPGVASDWQSLHRAAVLAVESRALSATLLSHPEILDGPQTEMSVTLQMRAALARAAADDIAGLIPSDEAWADYADAIDSVVDRELGKARTTVAERHPAAADIPFAVVAMGKWGARELNYHSDIDLLFVHDAGAGEAEEARAAAQALASRLIANLGSPTFDGPALVVDANLRPEGAMGPLSRSVDSYRRYYDQWGEPWELQALLRARHAAGDDGTGRAFERLAAEVVWETTLSPDALRSIRRIKERSEAAADPRDIKRSRGGIRDIEFTVQVLQLVHGRRDAELRLGATLDAIGALAASGLIDESDRLELSDSYLFLRNLENRIQIWDLRQTHQMPADGVDLDRIGISLGLPAPSGEALVSRLASVRSAVRATHERLYFRPILDALVGSASARIDTSDASLRLQALGFSRPDEATSAVADLTAGTSRRARVMNQLLPLMLDWLSQSPDPDMGLAQLRLVLAHTRDHSALVTLLQTNPLAGQRLCLLLGSGRLMGSLIDRIPEFIPRLADDARLDDVRDLEDARGRLLGLLETRKEDDARVGTIRRFARRRRLRIAARDVLTDADARTTMRSLSETADAVMEGAIATAGSPAGFLVLAMGRWGGRELSYESDLDLMYVYSDDEQRDIAFRTAADLHRILSEPGRHGEAYQLDAGLRPEGKSGPLARSVEGYARYYAEWAEAWELLALIKARPVAGDLDVAAELFSNLEDVIWKPDLPAGTAYEIRAIKARVENERIPPGEDPDYHLKLGRGGLSDVEFLTQLLQLQHGGRHAGLREPETVSALNGLHAENILDDGEYRALLETYTFCNRVRLRLHLQLGRAWDSLPTDPVALGRLAGSLGFDRSVDLRDEYRRVTRRARSVFEQRFFG